MARTRRFGAFALGLALSLAACSDGDSDTSETLNAGTTTVAPSDATTTTGAAATTQTPADLEALLSDRVPAGFRLTAFDEGETGPSDFEKAVSDDGNTDARDLLTRTGFVAGFQHLWVNGSDFGDQILQYLYQFRDNSGAVEYRDRTLAQFKADTPFGTRVATFDVGIPGASAFEGLDEERAGAVVLFAEGPYVVHIVSLADAGPDVAGRITPLAQDQLSRL